MIEIFKAAVERGASDIHLKSGDVVRARLHGKLVPITQQRLSHEQVQALVSKVVTQKRYKDDMDRLLDYDCSWGVPGLGRFRVNILRQRGTLMVVMRVIPMDIPTFKDLNLPPVLETIAQNERGLILVTGVTGSGKSSTMAAIIQYMNERFPKHIVTLENPIEFLHRDQKASITQRDVGSDTETFMTGLRAALRQDPDVILIGEMRDNITIDTALKAAETGHLVISTVHTTNAVQTISRVIAVFAPEEQAMIRVRLAEQLMAIISQRLLPRKDGKGRQVALEVMPVTGTMRDCIQDPRRMEEIPDLIEEGRSHIGSQSFDQHLIELVSAGIVDFEVAKAHANNPGDFDLKMNVFGSESGGASTPGTVPSSGSYSGGGGNEGIQRFGE